MRRTDAAGTTTRGTASIAALVLLGTTLFVGPIALPTQAAIAADLSAAEARGKLIYTTGESQSSRIITAAVSRSAAPASASILPCIQCHGADGRGIGVISPDVNWGALTSPAGHEHLQRTHGPFDDRSLRVAIIDGVDPAGNELEATMPRYQMTDEDLADLIAYLKRIDSELDPGLSPSHIRIGTVLPTAGPLGGEGQAMRAIIEAMFRDINAAGGVHGRHLELIVGEYGSDSTPAFWNAQDFVSREPLFALVASYLPGYETEFSNLVSEKQIPLVGPHTLFGTIGGSRYEFFLRAGLREQAQALADVAIRQDAEPGLAVVYPHARGFDVLADAVRARAEEHGVDKVATAPYVLGAFDAARAVRLLKDAQVESVVFLGSGQDLVELARVADDAGWHPEVFATAALAERALLDLPPAFDGRVLLAYASLPADRTRNGIEDFESLHRDHALDYDNSIAQIAAYSAVRVLVEGLERAGPNPDRETLVGALESLQGFEPGLTAPISYGPERRIGSLGAHVVRVDLASGRLDAEHEWIDLAAADRAR